MRAGYIAALDGWRGLSILLVLASHASGLSAIPGGLGVTVFFFVSGLLISGQLLDEIDRRGRVDLGRFYWRRALRLLPASTLYIAVAGLVFIGCGGVIGPAAWAAALGDGANYAEIASRLFETNLHGVAHPFVIRWSLGIEEQFYLAWPARLRRGSRGPGRWPLFVLLACCIAGPLAWRLHLETLCGHGHGLVCGPHGDSWIAKSTETRADSLAWGALAAALLRSSLHDRFVRLLRSPLTWTGGMALLLVTLGVRDESFRETVRFTLQGCALLVLVTGTATPEAASSGGVLCSPVLVTVGRLSYGLYLWHWLALLTVARLGLRHVAGDLTFVVLTAGLTLLSWFLVERPAIRLRRRAGSNATERLVPWGAVPALVRERASLAG